MDDMLSKPKSGKKRKGSRSRNENLQLFKRAKGVFCLLSGILYDIFNDCQMATPGGLVGF